MAGSVRGAGRSSTGRRPTAADRFAVRTRSVRSRRRRLVACALAAALLAGLAAWAVSWSTLLDVRTVEVVGTHRVTIEEVKAAAAVPLGRPLARLDTVAVGRRVEQISWVADVSVIRRWPHTVRIVVEERQPAVAVPAPGGGGFLLVDRTGFVVATLAEQPAGVPLIVGMDATTLGEAGVDAVVETLAAVPAKVRAKVTEVAAPSPNSVTLTLRDGVQIYWGSAQDGTHKAAVLTALMRRKARLYDVSSPVAPATRG
jgi:cell division protein FtsQ